MSCGANRAGCDTRGVFAVVLTGPPGAGKTVALTALSDALVKDQVAHAAVDVDEIAWTFPFPSLAQRCDHLRAWCIPHRRAGHDVLLVAEVIESSGHLGDVLAALGADDHLLVRLDAPLATLRQRIVDREPPGWSSLAWLLDETPRLQTALAGLDGVHLPIDTEHVTSTEIVERIRSAGPGKLSGTRGDGRRVVQPPADRSAGGRCPASLLLIGPQCLDGVRPILALGVLDDLLVADGARLRGAGHDRHHLVHGVGLGRDDGQTGTKWSPARIPLGM